MNTFRFESIQYRPTKGLHLDYGRSTVDHGGLQTNLNIKLSQIQKRSHKLATENFDKMRSEKREAEKLIRLKSLVNDDDTHRSSALLIHLNRTPKSPSKHMYNTEPRRHSSYNCCRHRQRPVLPHLTTNSKNGQSEKVRPKTTMGQNKAKTSGDENCHPIYRRKGYMLPTSASISRYDRINVSSLPNQLSFSPKRPIPKGQREKIHATVFERRQPDYSYTYVPRVIRSRRKLQETSDLEQFEDDSAKTTSEEGTDRHHSKFNEILMINRRLEDRVKIFVREIDTFNNSQPNAAKYKL